MGINSTTEGNFEDLKWNKEAMQINSMIKNRQFFRAIFDRLGKIEQRRTKIK